MGILNICSRNSYYRGLDYYEEDRVKDIKRMGPAEFEARVLGSEEYFIKLNIEHPRKSSCSCPFASGKRVVCKHMVATYFKIFPEEAQAAIQKRKEELLAIEEEEKKYFQILNERYAYFRKYVDSLDIEEIKELLVRYLVDESLEDVDDSLIVDWD